MLKRVGLITEPREMYILRLKEIGSYSGLKR